MPDDVDASESDCRGAEHLLLLVLVARGSHCNLSEAERSRVDAAGLATLERPARFDLAIFDGFPIPDADLAALVFVSSWPAPLLAISTKNSLPASPITHVSPLLSVYSVSGCIVAASMSRSVQAESQAEQIAALREEKNGVPLSLASYCMSVRL